MLIAFSNAGDDQDIFVVVIVTAIAILRYFILKRGIARGKYEFERELIYIAQKP
ncbi:hypothetical protein [Chryseobacterium sp.]|uniref:hypothetical protein n=1 Tax=Chryseobacterium sp. TaxID=1871047 RepID=UPI0025B98844|nr:hypothetical protein [Chryseobacterium sp.]MBV8328806.1 hypothetical protein [Chryseobacterium sp.]